MAYRFLLVCVGILLFSISPCSSRTWTSVDGKTLKAQFSSATDDSVKLISEDGSTFTLPIARLCEADRWYIRVFRNKPKLDSARIWRTTEGRKINAILLDVTESKALMMAPESDQEVIIMDFEQLVRPDREFLEDIYYDQKKLVSPPAVVVKPPPGPPERKGSLEFSPAWTSDCQGFMIFNCRKCVETVWGPAWNKDDGLQFGLPIRPAPWSTIGPVVEMRVGLVELRRAR